MSTSHTVLSFLPSSAKNYQSWWKFDEVLTKTILHIFEIRCTSVLTTQNKYYTDICIYIIYIRYLLSCGILSITGLLSCSLFFDLFAQQYYLLHFSYFRYSVQLQTVLDFLVDVLN